MLPLTYTVVNLHSGIPRRKFLASAALSSGALVSGGSPPVSPHTASLPLNEEISLDGLWLFRLDEQNIGEAQSWFRSEKAEGWRPVKVPHTWQVEPEHAEYMGVAWYHRAFWLLSSGPVNLCESSSRQSSIRQPFGSMGTSSDGMLERAIRRSLWTSARICSPAERTQS